VSLILYQKGKKEIDQEIPFPESAYTGAVRTMKVQGLCPDELEYNFRIGEKVTVDPCARLVNGRRSFADVNPREEHQIRGAFLNGAFDWEGEQPLMLSYEEVITYQLHVRGFTKHRNSKVRHKGTFRGIQEKIPYLKELGINQIILMPAYEFDELARPEPMGNQGEAYEDPENIRLNYWGYTRGGYYAPKLSYSASDTPDLEMKEMVHSLHKNGIEVVMEFCFPSDVSAGMAADCLRWWVQEYHIDGFSLMMDQNEANMLARDPYLMKTKLISGYFPADSLYPKGQRPAFRNLAECNDGFKVDARRLLKGDEDQLTGFVERTKKNPKWSGVINYITGHDGFTLMDLVSYDQKHNEANGEQNRDGAIYNYSWNCGIEGPTKKRNISRLRIRQMKNAFAMLLLAQGTPMILAGDEFGNSQKGNNNPYCHDSELTWVDWNKEKVNWELLDFVKQLIAYRKNHEMLHFSKELAGADTLSCGYPDFSCHGSRAWYGAFEHVNRHVGLMYCGMYAGEESFIYVAYNLFWDSRQMALPYLPEGMEWYVVLDTSEEAEQSVKECRLLEAEMPDKELVKFFEIPERSVRVLETRKKPAAARKAAKSKGTRAESQKTQKDHNEDGAAEKSADIK
ncbi:MAG: alpha-amylase family glycosyl hydrolase, partial [Lachnospiraceae bacterium]|nr:alpha-amylase family glycosyl hydrolase [Lachnospiraceae bacterium]